MCNGNCGTCIFHKYDDFDQDYYCDNESSDNYTCYTGYEDVCIDYEEKED